MITFPRIDYLIHNKHNKMDFNQNSWYYLLARLSNIINLSTDNYTDFISGEFLSMQLSVFMKKVYEAIQFDFEQTCRERLLFDDFIKIANFSEKAIKNIVQNPSTKLIKEDKFVHASKLHDSNLKTMQWLSRRPGHSVEEKIAPKNKILTKKTRFTVNTKENQETMYLYDILYSAISNRKIGDCVNCNKKKLSCKELTERMLRLVSLKSKIVKTELSDVSRIKNSIQNNKLLCDKNYKIIWDSTKQLSSFEKKLEDNWNNLDRRYHKVIYWALISLLLKHKNVKVFDDIGKISDNNGFLSFLEKENEKIKLLIENDNYDIIYLELIDSSIEVKIEKFISNNGISFSKSNESNFSFSMDELFEKVIKHINFHYEDIEKQKLIKIPRKEIYETNVNTDFYSISIYLEHLNYYNEDDSLFQNVIFGDCVEANTNNTKDSDSEQNSGVNYDQSIIQKLA